MVVWLVLTLFAVMVMVRVPVVAVLDVLTVMVELPAPLKEVGLKETVSPLPWPEAERLMEPLNPPVMEVMIVAVPEEPRSMVSDAGEAETLKLPVAEVTVRFTVVVSVVPPLVPSAAGRP